jgi:hypothetical protein
MEPDYIPDSKVCFRHDWTPFPNGGCGGDFPPTTFSVGVQGGFITIFVSPPERVIWFSAPEVKFWKKLPCKIL